MVLDIFTKNESELEQKLIDVRRNLHQEPELSNEEVKTTLKIRKWLEEADIDILDLPLKTGVIGEISGNVAGPTIAIRADIDALPIHEQADIPFPSTVPGVMHACGHDFHTAVILGAAYLLKKRQENLKGTVRVLFQPAEETGHGAKAILASKGLENVEAIFGLHNDPLSELGVLGTKEGVLTAGVDRFEIEVKGKGSHAAKPEEGIDPIIIAAEIISRLQTIVSREAKSSESVVISVTQIHGGNTWNVIPESVYLEGTVRTFKEEIRKTIPAKIERVLNGVAASYGGEARLIWHPGPPSVQNDKEWTLFAKRIAVQNGYKVVEVEPTAGGEDFAFYQQKIRGAFVNIGVAGEYGLHHPKYYLNEEAILPASYYFADLAEQALVELYGQSLSAKYIPQV
ncbi:amidohydrolase [Niallia sp. 01092]|uniref:amidohydrolase n=1 Tax=unclassified Niallia TaxID=2837522 RepID=UPI003FD526C9